jgi:hypothetical protein
MFSTLLPSSELTEYRGIASVVCLHVAISGLYQSDNLPAYNLSGARKRHKLRPTFHLEGLEPTGDY